MQIVDIFNLKDIDTPVTVNGWITNIRSQKKVCFIELRDGTSPTLFQAVVKDPLLPSISEQSICHETAISLTGTLKKSPNAKGGVEMLVTSCRVIGPSSSSFATLKNFGTHYSSSSLQDIRVLVLRDELARKVFRLRALILAEIRSFMASERLTEVEPPSIVTNQVEGGSTLFKVDYYGAPAYLTQSSQLYLEGLCPVLGDVFCMMTNYRAERSNTRRHLSEYTHLETEKAFMTFESLLSFVERTLLGITKLVLSKHSSEVEELNPGFCAVFSKIESKFATEGKLLRMSHKEAIDYCNSKGIRNDEGKAFEYGEDISEAPERQMVESLGQPVLLTRFPTDQKPFYMKRCSDNEKETESVDLCLPGVGEVLGGSMREGAFDELEKRIEEHGLDRKGYEWYLDLRKYGHAATGGYGLGVDRYLCWVLGQDHIRKVVLLPRYYKHCYP